MKNTTLNISYENLTKFPEEYLPLPSSLERLYCSDNQLTELPELPSSLERLDCSNNQLTELPELPSSLERLYCYDNQLTQLPELPISLEELYCSNNQLTQLPELPISLERLWCNDNLWSKPLNSEIVEKFGIVYTEEQLTLWNSEEYQIKFLRENPYDFKDLPKIHPNINLK